MGCGAATYEPEPPAVEISCLMCPPVENGFCESVSAGKSDALPAFVPISPIRPIFLWFSVV